MPARSGRSSAEAVEDRSQHFERASEHGSAHLDDRTRHLGGAAQEVRAVGDARDEIRADLHAVNYGVSAHVERSIRDLAQDLRAIVGRALLCELLCRQHAPDPRHAYGRRSSEVSAVRPCRGGRIRSFDSELSRDLDELTAIEPSAMAAACVELDTNPCHVETLEWGVTGGAVYGCGGVDRGAREPVSDFRHRSELVIERLRYLARNVWI